ncbi:hypothetical protein [Brevibacterium ihuae]|uniref:hypothetical protein n=1 Tax=Brevibacterium ihuae TaxID=1631743 RepID=UPI000C772FF4|nr:hypothetical protein [Brevibacterium ihuae]
MFNTISNNYDDNTTTAGLVQKALTAIGVKIPEFASRPAIGAPAGDLKDRVFKCYANGTDPITDPGVRDELLRELLAQRFNTDQLHRIEQSKARLQHYIDHADTITKKIREKFTAAVDTLESAHESLGPVDLYDIKGGTLTEDAAQRRKAQEALAVTETILTHWGSVFPLITRQNPGVAHREPHLRFMAPTLEQTENHRLAGGRRADGKMLTVWDALGMPITVELATEPSEVNARYETIHAAAKKRAATARSQIRL